MHGISIFSLLIIAIIVIYFTAIIISSVVHRKRLNKALENAKKQDCNSEDYKNNSIAHSAVPTPATTASFLSKLVIIVLLLYVCVTLNQISELRAELSNLDSYINRELPRIMESVDCINSMIDINPEYSKHVSSFDVDVNNPDYKNNLCDVTFNVSFSEINTDADVTLKLDSQNSIKLEKVSSGNYAGTTKLPLYDYTGDKMLTISISSSETEINEILCPPTNINNLWTYYLPSLSESFFVTDLDDDDHITIDSSYLFWNNDESSIAKLAGNIKEAELVIKSNASVLTSEKLTEQLTSATTAKDFINLNDINLDKKDLGEDITSTLIISLNDGSRLETLLFNYDIDEKSLTAEGNITLFSQNGEAVFSATAN